MFLFCLTKKNKIKSVKKMWLHTTILLELHTLRPLIDCTTAPDNIVVRGAESQLFSSRITIRS